MKRAWMVYNQGKKLFPDLSRENASVWMGERPTLPDYVPVMDRVEGQKGIFVSVGHHHLGLTQAAVSSEFMTQMIMGKDPVKLNAFSMKRFS